MDESISMSLGIHFNFKMPKLAEREVAFASPAPVAATKTTS